MTFCNHTNCSLLSFLTGKLRSARLKQNTISTSSLCDWKDTFDVDGVIQNRLDELKHISCQPSSTRLFNINMRSAIHGHSYYSFYSPNVSIRNICNARCHSVRSFGVHIASQVGSRRLFVLSLLLRHERSISLWPILLFHYTILKKKRERKWREVCTAFWWVYKFGIFLVFRNCADCTLERLTFIANICCRRSFTSY